MMKTSGEVTVERGGKTFGATYEVKGSMVIVKTHTETRSLQLDARPVDEIARAALNEIVDAARPA